MIKLSKHTADEMERRGILFSSEEVAPGVFVEFDPNGNPIGVEVISVRRRSGEIAPMQAAAK